MIQFVFRTYFSKGLVGSTTNQINSLNHAMMLMVSWSPGGGSGSFPRLQPTGIVQFTSRRSCRNVTPLWRNCWQRYNPPGWWTQHVKVSTLSHLPVVWLSQKTPTEIFAGEFFFGGLRCKGFHDVKVIWETWRDFMTPWATVWNSKIREKKIFRHLEIEWTQRLINFCVHGGKFFKSSNSLWTHPGKRKEGVMKIKRIIYWTNVYFQSIKNNLFGLIWADLRQLPYKQKLVVSITPWIYTPLVNKSMNSGKKRGFAVLISKPRMNFHVWQPCRSSRLFGGTFSNPWNIRAYHRRSEGSHKDPINIVARCIR